MAQNHVLSNVSCCVGRNENLTYLSEIPWNEDAKIGIGLISSSNTSRENQQMLSLNNLGFIDVLSTVNEASLNLPLKDVPIPDFRFLTISINQF